jgi:folylpolyglutamate synthase
MLPVLPATSPLQSIKLGIPGAHQKSNAQLALELYRTYLKSSAGEALFDSSSGADGLSESEEKGLQGARWPGRCQTVRSKDHTTVWFLDGAHTTESLESCAAWFVKASREERQKGGKVKRALIFNTTHDRKSEELLNGMMEAVGTELSKERGTETEALAGFFDQAIFCTNSTYKDGLSAGGECRETDQQASVS